MSSTAVESKTRVTAAIIMAMLAILGSAVVMLGSESQAAIEGDYGEVYEIDLAPGFQYTYTPTYPSDLEVTTTIQEYEEEGITASMSDGTLTVTVNSGITSGSYDIILMATTETGGIHQELPMHIRVNVVEGLSVSGSINNLILGASVDFTPNASSGMTEHIDWTVNGELPAGLEWDGSKITGTPTQVGTNSLSLTANAAGETKNLDITFTVYNVIVNGSEQSIFSHGNTVSTTPVSQTVSGNAGDLNVTWAVTNGTLPSGFSIDPATGVISGSSTELQETTVTVTGTDSAGSEQTASFQVTIRSEPELQISGDNSVTTYPGADDRTVQLSATSGTSAVTWSVTEATGVSISQAGLLTVTDEATTGSVTVTATTAYGQSKTYQVSIVSESVLDISGDASVSAIAGTPMESAYTVRIAGATWSVDTASVPEGANVSIDSSTGILTLSGSSPTDAFTVTVNVTTASGQSDSMVVTCQIVSQLIFNNDPSNGAAVWVLA